MQCKDTLKPMQDIWQLADDRRRVPAAKKTCDSNSPKTLTPA